MPGSPAELFLRSTTARFREEYLPRLRTAVHALPPGDLWWRPHAGSNCVGNLLLHLEGNVRQWILSGLGGEPDHRQRASEFSARDSDRDAEQLLERLAKTVEEVCRVVEAEDPRRLAEACRIQGFETTRLEAIYHVLEHFGWHLGQIAYVAKMRGGPEHGVAFYDDAVIDQARNE